MVTGDAMMNAAPLFELDGVSFAAGGREILRPLDLVLARGQIVGLLGPNGSGKSTLVKLLARQLKPTSGKIRFDGRDIAEGPDRAFARRLAYLPQFMPSADGMTVEEFVALGRFPWHGTFGRTGEADRTAIEAAIRACELVSMRKRLVDELSGGERQRVWLALMLAQETEVLLLDEPTSALDIAHQADMLALLAKLAAERALSVVIVLHDVNMAARLCDRLVALGQGRIVADAEPQDIMIPQTLHRIYGVDMAVFAPTGSSRPVAYLP